MVEKLSKKRYSPHLFDVTQDIIGALPLKLVERWLNSEQTYAEALQLLEGHRVKGYSVSSDSVGLTRLTQQRGLLEILTIIDRPKRIVYGYGRAIAGQSVGIWAADNTQMFYPDQVEAATLIAAMLTIQDQVMKSCQIKIGLAAHYGSFYAISGGLYGAEADAIEDVAENRTSGGEILITQALRDRLPFDHNFTLEQRHDLIHDFCGELGNVYRVLDGARLAQVQPASDRYPIPYSEEFYTDLLTHEHQLAKLTPTQNLAHNLSQSLALKYVQQKVVVLIESKNESVDKHEVAMFNQLSFTALMKDIGLQCLQQLDQEPNAEIKVINSLVIYAFDQPRVALDFAQSFRKTLAEQKVTCRIGIDQGEVLIFSLASGTKDIAGAAVNVASKMAQDCGKFGKIYLSTALVELAKNNGFREFSTCISEVEFIAYEG